MAFLLIAAAFAAGAINSIAGGGSFLTFPALVFSGIPAVMANASSTVALVPGSLASTLSYRKELQQLDKDGVKAWLIVSVLGGMIGAALLLCTSDRVFRQIAPWLLLFATLLFAFGNQLSVALRGRVHPSQMLMVAFLFPVSVYGGYFGGGMGIMILAGFRLYGLTDIHAMNGMKALLAGSLNMVAGVLFIATHQVNWHSTLLMMGAAILGGYAGPVIARRMPQPVIRATVIFVGAAMTVYFFHIAPK
ncbi:MAG: sulfite exporter TauE/SafE family protein [Bryobacteraceae bacterium]